MELKKGRYQHFKGKFYNVLGVARDCEDPKKLFVVYQALYDSAEFGKNQIWIRPLDDFLGEKELENGKKVPRFKFVD